MSRKIKIGNRVIGDGEPCFLVAEIGSNFNQNLEYAKQLIDAAAAATVDAVKFQVFRADWLTPADSVAHPILKNNEINRSWLMELKQYCESKNLIFMSTPFDQEAVDLLEDIGITSFKWASPEIFDLPLLKYAARRNKPIIMSTGMATIEDIRRAVNVIKEQGNEQIILLHCVSLYPTDPKDAHLRMMKDIRKHFDCPVGFSDHTMSIAVPIAAVVEGACMIEKHITLDRKLDGPDHFFALEPEMLKEMVQGIRDAEESLGLDIKGPISGKEQLHLHQKSIVARRDIKKGDRIEVDMIFAVRSPKGIDPKRFDDIVGSFAKQNIPKYNLINWDMVEHE